MNAAATDPRLTSWLAVPPDSDFPIQNLPYGIVSARARDAKHVAVAIGESALDLAVLAQAGLFDAEFSAAREIFSQDSLNEFLALGPDLWSIVRARLSALLAAGNDELRSHRDVLDRALLRLDDVAVHLPVRVGDYVDFYSSLEHATNMGKILRPGSEPLLPNWRHLPIAYHGRASTIVVGGTPVVRPCGQQKSPADVAPRFGPTQMLDVELEVGFFTGPGNAMGSTIPVASAGGHIFGLVLVNDWSARDIQAWEYQPLGPFLGKSFATSVSPWVVTMEALAPFQVAAPPQDPDPLEYLRGERTGYDIKLQIALQTQAMRAAEKAPKVVCSTNFRHLYWTMEQQLAHAASNGTAVRPGDLYASGTISGDESSSFGSLMELTWRGARPLELPGGERRAFLEDGDVVVMRGWCEKPGHARIGFGELAGAVLPAAAP